MLFFDLRRKQDVARAVEGQRMPVFVCDVERGESEPAAFRGPLPSTVNHDRHYEVDARLSEIDVTAALNRGVVFAGTGAAPVRTSTEPISSLGCVAVGILKKVITTRVQGLESRIVGRTPISVPSFNVIVARPLSGALSSWV